MESAKMNEEKVEFTLFSGGELRSPFIPWTRSEQGQQSFIKLARGDQMALLYSGMETVLRAEVQKILMRLLNEGWQMEGEVHLIFRGSGEMDFDILFQRDPLTLELSSHLLPLVDPCQGAPLLERLNSLREEIAQEIGLVTPGIRVKDNIRLPPNRYVILLREVPLAEYELFLNRYLAVGTLEQLAGIPGWSTIEPAFRANAKWIEAGEKDAAERAGCMLLGSLSVLLTHLKEVLKANAARILGLQDIKFLLERLGQNYPVVVEDFLQDNTRLRRVRKILQNLLEEKVSIRNLVTILETIGDHQEELDETDLMTECVRLALATQICSMCVDAEGVMRGLLLSESLEQKMIHALSNNAKELSLNDEEKDEIIAAVKRAVEEYSSPGIVFCKPPLRPHLSRLLRASLPGITVISLAEIVPGVRVEVAGEIKVRTLPPKEKGSTAPPQAPAKKFWKKKR